MSFNAEICKISRIVISVEVIMYIRKTTITSYVTTMFEHIERRKTDVFKIIKKRTVAVTVYTINMLL